MNKKIISTGIVLTASLLLSGCTKQSSPSAPQPANKTASEASEFAKAIQSGKPTVCTLTKDGSSMEYMLKGKMMRANITTTVNSKNMISHMINDQTYLYVWADGQKQGTKMSAIIPSPSPMKTPSPQNTAPQLSSESDYDGLKGQGYTIDCKSGNVDDSTFTPPEDIQFIDPTAMMKQVADPKGGSSIDMEKIKELQKQYGGQ